MRVRVAQCLCPNRHAIMALVFTSETITDASAIEALRAAVRLALNGEAGVLGLAVKKLNAWCGICGKDGGTWLYEIEWSKEFDSLEAAEHAIHELQTAQAVSRALLDHMGVTFDAYRKRGLN